MSPTVLRVEKLTTQFQTKTGQLTAVNGVSFALRRGEILGLVGESGSGKSQTGYSIMGLIDRPGRVTGGQVLLNGQDIRPLPEAELRRIRGKRIAMIFQDPMLALNPVLRIDTQMMEAVQAHRAVSRAQALGIARQALVKVGIPSPDERLASYPHQFSGGMRQRVAIAIALLHDPEVIIADEPTTALDVTIQEQILFEMQKLAREAGTAMIWITHDLSVVAGLADSIAVMYAGRIVEYGPAADILERPEHPYTQGLIGSTPARNRPGARLQQIPGSAPNLAQLPAGCAFRPRCDQFREACATMPELLPRSDTRQLRCHLPFLSAQAGAA